MQISDIDPRHSPSTIKEGLGSQFSFLTGLAILGGVTLAFIALATWSVTDPSLSYAKDEEVNNFLGYPGAVFADFAMQFLGLASALALIPPAIWGWSKLLQRNITAARKRLALWPLAVLCSAAVLSSLSIPANWPLPVGMGGVGGDMILSMPATLAGGVLEGTFAVIIGVIFSVISIVLLLASAELIFWQDEDLAITEAIDFDAEAEFMDEENDEPNWMLGAAAHYYYVAKMRFTNGSKSGASGISGFINGLKARFNQTDDGLDDFAHPQQASQYSDELYDAHDVGQNPEYGENVYQDAQPQEEWAEQPIAPAPMAAAPVEQTRVQTMAPPPKQSKRIEREAQPSLIKTADFELPSLHFLQNVPERSSDMILSKDALEQNARMLEGVLEDFGVKGEILNVRPGPVVTLYELEPAPGIKSSRVIGLADDIARSMSAVSARVAVVPGKNAIGIELPNTNRETVYLREILASQTYEGAKAKLPLILGKTIGGEATIADLAKMPHLLVAGTTGSGKSVAINTIILSLLYRFTPEQVKLIMIDPKMLELSIYDGIPHLLTPVVTDPKKAVVALKWSVREMEERYKKMSKIGVRNIDGYNARAKEAQKSGETFSRTIQTGYDRDTGEAIYETEEIAIEPMPYIVVIIDEMADLMMVAGKDIEGTVQRLAQMARAAGIHVIMATQRPSTDVITGTIKANFPTRISFQVTSKIDSRVMLGESGAEQLLGMGDMLYMAGGGRIQRVHGPFVDDGEVDQVVTHLKAQGVPQYLDSVTEEQDEGEGQASGDAGALSESNDIYDQAVAIVLRDRKVSTSYIQRRLSIGYNRAASLIERMEQEGLISAANHAGKREILVPDENETI